MCKSFLVIFLCCSTPLVAQVDSIAVLNQLKKHIVFLASDSLKGRATGSPEEAIANQYIRQEWSVKKRKTEVVLWDYTIFQENDTLPSQMIGSFINNKSKHTLLIGAHIDHIGSGGVLSKSIGKHEVHNGADDNASGVAILIELQRHLAKQKLPFNVLLVAFTGHEIGTYGSAHLSTHLTEKYGKVFCMLNMDMVGRMDPETKKLFVSCSDTLAGSFESNTLKAVRTDDTRLQILDTKYFVAKHIPCATFTTGMHNDYHRTTDDAAYINIVGMLATLQYLETWIGTKAKSFLPLTALVP